MCYCFLVDCMSKYINLIFDAITSAFSFYFSNEISDSGIYKNGIVINGKNRSAAYNSNGDRLLNKSINLSNGSRYYSPVDVL